MNEIFANTISIENSELGLSSKSSLAKIKPQSKLITLLQTRNQLQLTQKILLNKENQKQELNANLLELDSTLKVVEGIASKDKIDDLRRQKENLSHSIEQTNKDIENLNKNISHLQLLEKNSSEN